MTPTLQIINADCLAALRELPAESVHCCVTSPPYWGLRDYGVVGQIGLEETPAAYVERMVEVMGEVHRVLRADGTLWLNLGDSYAGSWGAQGHRETPATISRHSISNHPKRASQTGKIRESGIKAKDLIGIPWRVAFALQVAGWYLREDIIWAKPNCMPESVTDRCTRSHEYLFHLSKSPRYFHDAEAIKEPAIYDVNGTGTAARKARQNPESKSQAEDRPGPGRTNGIRAAGFKDAAKMNGKHSDKQRGHSRRHDGFNDRWDNMEKAEQCSGMRNKRSVWTVAPANYPEAHFATYPPALIRPCILAGCPVGGTVLDPFGGSGTTGQVALELGRSAILIELNPAYCDLIRRRCAITPGLQLETSPAA